METRIASPYGGEIGLSVDDSWDVLDRAAEVLEEKTVFVLLDNRVSYFHGEIIRRKLLRYPFKHVELFHANEIAKIVSNVFPIYEHLSSVLPATQASAIMAIGGGVTLNVGGFIASTLGRGIPLVVVPTTPMSISDVAFGSKHGLNTYLRKNHVGSYYNPTQILVNTSSISSITPRHIKRNSIESLKQFLGTDRSMYSKLQDYYRKEVIDVNRFCHEILLPSAYKKMEILRDDPGETNEGRILQFGHFLAHSIEVASGFSIPHERAVALGIYVELRKLASSGLFSETDYQDVRATLAMTGIEFTGISFDEGKFKKAAQTSKLLSANGKIDILNIGEIGRINQPATIQWDVVEAVASIKEWLQ